MKDLMKHTLLEELLGSEKMDELKSKLVDVIVDEVREQLHQSNDYIVSPDDIAEALYDEIVEEVKLEVINSYKDRVMQSLEQKLNSALQ